MTRSSPSVPKSTSHNTWTGNSTYSEAKIKTSLTDSQGDGTNASAKLGFHVSGNNDLIGISPNIDTKGDISSTVQGENGSTTFSGKVWR